ncbi:MAG: tetratricopeptide repeat protein, partial [Cyanobacteria bacterium P01_A01_bin.123]
MELDPQNQDAYDDLITAIEAGGQRLSLLIAVCDDSRLREAIIQRYEAELSPEWQCRQVALAHDKPSLKTAIANAVPNDSTRPALVTVLGAEQLHFLKFDQDKSEQEEFLGYLQWTREALREFQLPIVLWLTNQLVAQVSKSAKDFWSWRKDVFRFSSKKTGGISRADLDDLRDHFQGVELPSEDAFALPLKDLEVMIEHTSTQNPDDPLLATLYQNVGNVYLKRAESGEFQDYQRELNQAIVYYQQAINLRKKLEPSEDLAETLNQLARIHFLSGDYSEAEPPYLQALQLKQKLLGDEHPDVANSLNNLAGLYFSQGRYSEAEPLYLQSLQLRQKLLGDDHPDVAYSLNNLALLYSSQGRY